MTDLEAALIDAWSRLDDAEAEHDREAAARAWEYIQYLQQRCHTEAAVHLDHHARW